MFFKATYSRVLQFYLLGFSNPSSLLSEFFLSPILIMLYTFLSPQNLSIFYGSDVPFH